MFLDAFSCPLWAVSVQSKPDALAVLVNDVAQDTGLISFTKTLSNRLQQSLAALVLGEHFDTALKSDPSDLKWISLPTFTQEDVTHALDQLHADLLFISTTSLSMLENMPGNLVIYPNKQVA